MAVLSCASSVTTNEVVGGTVAPGSIQGCAALVPRSLSKGDHSVSAFGPASRRCYPLPRLARIGRERERHPAQAVTGLHQHQHRLAVRLAHAIDAVLHIGWAVHLFLLHLDD